MRLICPACHRRNLLGIYFPNMRKRQGRMRENMNITRKITFKRASQQSVDIQKLSSN
jgi:hypothetical protein